MDGDEFQGDVLADEQEQVKSGIVREDPDVPDEREALIARLSDNVRRAKRSRERAMRRIEKCMRLSDGKQWGDIGWLSDDYDDRYTANLIQRHVHQRTSALYAKNPSVKATRRQRRMYRLWSGDMAEIEQAQMTLAAAMTGAVSGIPMDPMIAGQVQQAQELLKDFQEGQSKEHYINGLGETLEILSGYFQSEQIPRFKQQMKQAVRRALIAGVAFAKLGFQRKTEPANPDLAARLADAQNKLRHIDQLAADQQDSIIESTSAEAEELKLMVNDLTRQLAEEGDVILREGPVWSFPRVQRLIIDPACQELVDFVGADWVAEEYLLSREQVQQIYGKDVSGGKSGYTRYSAGGEPEDRGGNSSAFDPRAENARQDGYVCVWEYYDKTTGLVYVIADGYSDFLREPKAPTVELEQFFPYFTLCFNQLESADELYPESDVWLMRHAQREYNRSKEALRQHRHASRPLYVAAPGWASEEDAESMAHHAAHSVITLEAMSPGQQVGELIQQFPKIGLDPNLYETQTVFDDVQRLVGTQEANLGGTSKATATETSIAESSRMGSLASQTDDLDDMLTAMKRAEGQVMMAEMSIEVVMDIVGPGAVWPMQVSMEEIAKEIALEIEAGSSGKPNQAAEAQTYQQMAPILLQIPGVRPDKLAEVGLKIMDSRYRVDDFIDSGLPSIQAMNSMAGRASQANGAAAENAPENQGEQGVNNGPQPDQGGDLPGAPPPAMPGLRPV